MKVLISDQFEDSGREALTLAGCEVVYRPELTADSLTEAVRTTAADVLIVRSTAVTAATLDAGVLSLVVRAGAGYNTIDVAAASKLGIYVANCPGKNAIAVAELAFGLILALDRRIPDNVADLRAGSWNKKAYSAARGLAGRTLGLLGYGNIGREMAVRALAFGMPVVAWSRSLAAGAHTPDLPIAIAASPRDVAARCDVLSIHLALAKKTRGLVDASVLDALAPGSFVINTARAEIVDYDALARVVRERNIRVGLDVFSQEPSGSTGLFGDAITALPNVYGTHHIGASTDQAQEAIAAETVRIVTTYMRTGRAPNVVNVATQSPATYRLLVRHRDKPGVLAHVFDRLRSANLNAQESENVIFEGAEAAVARIDLDTKPSDESLEEIRAGHRDVLAVHLVAIR